MDLQNIPVFQNASQSGLYSLSQPESVSLHPGTHQKHVESKQKGIVVFSGGSAANSLVDVFNNIVEEKGCDLGYIIPISDNGGSSSELIRVFGGPGIGDIRSRLIRLIPDDENDITSISTRKLFNHRLPDDPEAARQEWLNIVEIRHDLWKNIPSERRELIRSYLNFLNAEIVTRVRPSSVFTFSRASIGNMFLTGARLFTGSLEAAIELLTLICKVSERTKVLPAVNTNFTHHIAAGLENGQVIRGQNAISHPSEHTAVPDLLSLSAMDETGEIIHDEDHDAAEDANLPGTLPILRAQNIAFSKEHESPLPARINRVWYINPYGQEIRLPANPKVIESLKRAQCVVYSIGSLYTSIIPSLILKGVGETLMNSTSIKCKVLILNGSIDRETGPPDKPFTAKDFVAAIAQACWDSMSKPDMLREKTVPRTEYSKFVTHVLYSQAPGTPMVDKVELAALGIEARYIYGKAADGNGARYDGEALGQALASYVSRKSGLESRRNTIVQ